MTTAEKLQTKERSLPATRVTSSQMETIEERAKLHDCSISEYIRFCISYESENNK